MADTGRGTRRPAARPARPVPGARGGRGGRGSGNAAALGRRGPWRMLPAGSTTAARLPFVMLLVGLLVAGLVTLLLLNTALNSGSFRLSALQQETKQRTDRAEHLRQQIQRWSAPGVLAQRAGELGMVPGGTPAFLAPNGKVMGKPSAAPGTDSAASVRDRWPSATPSPTASPSPSPSATPSVTPSPSGAASASPSPVLTPSAGRGR